MRLGPQRTRVSAGKNTKALEEKGSKGTQKVNTAQQDSHQAYFVEFPLHPDHVFP